MTYARTFGTNMEILGGDDAYDFDGPADTGSDATDDYETHMTSRGFECRECGEWSERGAARRRLCIVCMA